MAYRRKAPNLKFREPNNLASQSVGKLVKTVVNSCKYLGLTIFSLTSQNELIFSYNSFSLISVVLRYVLMVLAFMYHEFCREIFEKLVKEGEGSKVQNFTDIVSAYNTFIIDGFSLTFIFLKRHKIVEFQRKLRTFFAEHTENSYSEQVKCSIMIDGSCKTVKMIRNVIVVSFIYKAASSELYSILLFFEPQLATVEKTWKFYFLPAFALFWSTAEKMRLISRLWNFSFLLCFKIGAILTKNKLDSFCYLTYNQDHQQQHQRKLNEVLKMNLDLENLVSQFNEIFGLAFTSEIFSLILGIVLNVFSILIYLLSGNFVAFFHVGADIVVDSFLIYVICNAADSFEREVSS